MTLAILSIITIMLVAYVSTVSSDLKSTQSYSKGLKAEQIADGGLAQIVDQLRAEIIDPSKSTNFFSPAGSSSNAIYRPLAASNAVPEQMAISALSANPALAGVIKISLPGAPVFRTASANRANTNLASSICTTNTSLNGRFISAARWNKPLLVPPPSNLPPPNWIFVGRNGPVIPAPSGLSSSLSNTQAILGRYAFVVYDTSGLIDANAAGYSPVDFPGTALTNKGLAPWFDLTRLGGGDINAFIKWRNARNASTAASYTAYVTNAATNGFMQVANGDTAFLDRQELIKYAQTQDRALTNALPYLTTFSRELNGPVWGPSTNSGNAPYDYLGHQYGPTTASTTLNVLEVGKAVPKVIYNNNVFILNPRVRADYINNFGIARKAGEPLVRYRFPLDKLALLEKARGAGTLTASDITDIQKYFGLDYVTAGGNDPQGSPLASSGLYRHWSYPTTNPSYGHNGVTNRILTLDEVAALKRDPDFFELLQAGILSGSLGEGARYDGSSPSYASAVIDPDLNSYYQIMRIGANVMDQWNGDNCPVTITFDGWNFYGVADLPYIDEIFQKYYSTLDRSATNGAGAITPLVYFEMWNPHQNLGHANRPTNFRLIPSANDIVTNFIVFFDSPLSHYWPVATNTIKALPAPSPGGVVTFTAGASDYREPSLIWSGNPTIPTTYVKNANSANPGGASDRNVPIAGVQFPSFSLPTPGQRSFQVNGSASANIPWVPPTWTNTWAWQINPMGGLGYLLQYQDPTGSAWHTYATFAGLEPTTANPSNNWPLVLTWASQIPAVNNTTANSYSYPKSDPRTARWGAPSSSWAINDTPKNAGNSLSPTPGSYATYNAINNSGHQPFNGASPYRLDLWPVNTNSAAAPNFPDPDGTFRYGDAVYSAGHSPFYPKDPTRPLILNRPFVSVGDLGNVYRDVPWRTLDFYSPASADMALLDLFTLSDGPVVAGHVNPNTAPLPVLQAMLNGASLSTNGSPALPNVPALATAFRSAASNAPFISRSDIAARFMTNAAITGVSANNLKVEREAVIRALVESANTRTWNFLIDIVAQSGRYPSEAAPLSNSHDSFSVEGERRYWLHIAIDRYTGEIVDQQLEVVNE